MFQVLITDPIGLPHRVATIRRAAEAFGGVLTVICPSWKPTDGAIPVSIPQEWCPAGMELAKREYIRSSCHWLVAIRNLHLPADFFWGIDVDIHATDETWTRLFAETMDRQEDAMWPFFGRRQDGTRQCFSGLCRFSNRAVDRWLKQAEATREIISEVALPSILDACGGNMADLATAFDRKIYSRRSLRFGHWQRTTSGVDIRPGLLSHPCKFDDANPDNPPS